MICEEKVGLLADYETATKRFAGVVTELRRKIGTSAKAEYERLGSASDDTRVKSEQARLALERHTAAHGC